MTKYNHLLRSVTPQTTKGLFINENVSLDSLLDGIEFSGRIANYQKRLEVHAMEEKDVIGFLRQEEGTVRCSVSSAKKLAEHLDFYIPHTSYLDFTSLRYTGDYVLVGVKPTGEADKFDWHLIVVGK